MTTLAIIAAAAIAAAAIITVAASHSDTKCRPTTQPVAVYTAGGKTIRAYACQEP